jgi:hypothetical protein
LIRRSLRGHFRASRGFSDMLWSSVSHEDAQQRPF